MRKICVVLCVAVVSLLALPLALPAAEGSWNGWITDESCAAKGAKAEHKDCAKKCLENGQKLVFYNTADQKVYKLDNQELAGQHLGHEVTVKGSAEGDAIKVASIQQADGEGHAGHGH